MRAKATGIGGVFFKSKDPKIVREWYPKHPGIKIDNYGATFEFGHPGSVQGYLVWGIFNQASLISIPLQKNS